MLFELSGRLAYHPNAGDDKAWHAYREVTFLAAKFSAAFPAAMLFLAKVEPDRLPTATSIRGDIDRPFRLRREFLK